MNYVVHKGGSVTKEGREVGRVCTGDDGLAYVEFHDKADMPSPDDQFTTLVDLP